MFIRFRKKGQSTAEYVIVFGLVIAMVIAMRTYVQRGLQGRIKDALTRYGTAETQSVFTNNPFEPDYIKSNLHTTSNSYDYERQEDYGADVVRNTNFDITERTGTSNVTAPESNL